jgi:hypothetical protein
VTALLHPGDPGFDAETPDGGILAHKPYQISLQLSDGRTVTSGRPHGDSEPTGPVLRPCGGGTSHHEHPGGGPGRCHQAGRWSSSATGWYSGPAKRGSASTRNSFLTQHTGASGSGQKAAAQANQSGKPRKTSKLIRDDSHRILWEGRPLRPWWPRRYGRIASTVLRLTRREALSKSDAGWGDLTATDLRRQGIGPGMGPPGEQGPRAVAMPRDESR